MRVETIYTCDMCQQSFYEASIVISCSSCQDQYLKDSVINAMNRVGAHQETIHAAELFVGFKDEAAKDTYLRGARKGFFDALFWMADYFGCVEAYEKMTDELQEISGE